MALEAPVAVAWEELVLASEALAPASDVLVFDQGVRGLGPWAPALDLSVLGSASADLASAAPVMAPEAFPPVQRMQLRLQLALSSTSSLTRHAAI